MKKGILIAALMAALLPLSAAAENNPLPRTPFVFEIDYGFLPVCERHAAAWRIAVAATTTKEEYDRIFINAVARGECEPVGAGTELTIVRMDDYVATVVYFDGEKPMLRMAPTNHFPF